MQNRTTIPNFFVVGAAKAGTTSLWQYLKCHPQIFMPSDELYKEPCYFSTYGEHMGLDNYLNLFIQARKEQVLVGEASTAYLSDPVSADRIHAFRPDAKIIIVLRNPVSRAYSLYNWMVQDGYEYSKTFEDALALEEQRAKKEIPNWYEPQYYWNYQYFRSGLYSEQVQRYLKKFGDNVLILKFEELRDNPQKTYTIVCGHLGVEPIEVKNAIHNPGKRVISAKVQFLLRKVNQSMFSAATQSQNSREMILSLKEAYSESIEKISKVAGLSLYERLICRLLLRRITKHVNVYGNHAFKSIETKGSRDHILEYGYSISTIQKIKSETVKQLELRYHQDILNLCEVTGINFTNWL